MDQFRRRVQEADQRVQMQRVQSGDSVYEVTSSGGRRPVPARIQSGDSMYEAGTGRPVGIRMVDVNGPSDELLELEPSPVDEEELPAGWSSTKRTSRSYYTTTTTTSSTSSTSFLGFRDHSAIWWLTRVQRYSSYAINTYLAMHMTNVSLIPLATRSIGASDSYLLLTRPYYQSPLLEPAVVLLPAALHVASGLGLRLLRRRQTLHWYGGDDATPSEKRAVPWPRVSGTSALGMALVPLAVLHAFVNRAIPLRVEGGSSGIGLGYVSHAFAKHPWAAALAYLPLIAVAAAHATWGSAKWLGLAPGQATGYSSEARRRTRRVRWWAINGLAAIVAGLWAAGGLGVVARGGEMGGWRGKQWDELYRQIPLLGKYW